MKRISTLLIAVVVLLMCSGPQMAKASHAQGIDISYECLGNNMYRFTLNYYRDCAGISAPSSVTINLRSASCNQNFNVNLARISGPVEVSPLCAAQLSQSTCSGTCTAPCLPGVQQFVFQGTFTFTQSCPDWIISFNECCRNAAITNLVNPGSQNMFVTSTLNNTVGLCNSSPTFSSTPVPYICAGQRYCYNHGAVDPNGDSLVYSLINPLTGPYPGSNIPYSNASLNPSYPMFDTTGTIQFDPITGSMCVIPTLTTPGQVVVVAIRVQEFRNGLLIGSTTRDIQIVVLQCGNQQPRLNPADVVGLTGGVRIDSNSVQICPGATLSFNIVADDVNAADIVTMTSNAATVMPGATFNTVGNNPVTGTVTWTPTVAQVGFYNFIVTIRDNGCPILGTQIFNYDVTVVPSTSAGPDLPYCSAGSPVQLGAVGGTAFTWSTLSGGPANLSCTNCPNPTATPAATVDLLVVSNLSAICKNRDTVRINVVPNFTLDAGNDTTICLNGLANISSSATPTGAGFTPYTYSWSPPTGLSSTTVANPSAAPTVTTQYMLTATSAAGCQLRDSVRVTISGVAPIVTAPSVPVICADSLVALSSLVSLPCGITTNACTGPTNVGTIGSGAFANRDFGPYIRDATFLYSNRHQYLFRKTELDAMGFAGGGRISAIALNVTVVGGQINGLVVRMGCTSQTSFPSTSFFTGLATVKNSYNPIPAAGWNTITLDNPYMWDGLTSLVIEFCVNSQQAVGTGSQVGYDNYTGNVHNYFNDAFNPNACSSATGVLTASRPRMQFTYCTALPVGITFSWSPPNFLSNPTIANPIASPPTTTTYTVSVNDGVCIGSANVTVNASPNFLIDAGSDTTLCLNQPFNVNSSIDPGTYTFVWTPNLGVSNTGILNPTIFAPATTTYQLTATRNGCTRSDTVRVTVSGVAPIVAAFSDTTICPVGTANLNSTISQMCGNTTIPCSGPVNTNFIGNLAGPTSILYSPHYMFGTAPGFTGRRQVIFTRAELNTMGLTGGGRINSIALQYTTANSVNTDITVKMGCTSLTTWPSSGAVFVPGLTTVMTSSSITPAIGWTTYTFTNPFYWDGNTNLIVELCTNTPQNGPTSSDVRTMSTAPDYRFIYQAANAAGGCSVAAAMGSFQNRPNMQFSYCQAVPAGLIYSWTPPLFLSNPSIPNPTATPLQTTNYQLTVSDGGSCQGGSTVRVTIDSTNYVSGLWNNLVTCPTPSYQLDASVFGPSFVPNLPSCGANATPCSQPQYGRTVGTGTAATNVFYTPFWQVTTAHRAQFLYRASDLVAAGIRSGTITAIALDVVTLNSTVPYEGITIRMGCTSNTTLSSATGFLATTQVAGPLVNYIPSLGLNLITLSNPYDWNGTSNLVIEFCNTNTTVTTSDFVRYTDALGYTAGLVQFASSGTGCSLTPAANPQSGRPNIQFTVCPPPPVPFSYNWTPSTGLSNPNIRNPVYTDPNPSTADTLFVLVSGGSCTVFDTIIIPSCGLPVDFFQLYGKQMDKIVRLDWQTRFEFNVQDFVIERKDERGVYADIGWNEADGFTQGDRWYDFTDLSPNLGVNTYRIRARDFDGATSLSNEVHVLFAAESGLVSLYPNPSKASEGFFVEYFAGHSAVLNIELIDVWGRTISRNTPTLVHGMNKINYQTGNVARGTYIVKMKFGENVQLRKLVIVD